MHGDSGWGEVALSPGRTGGPPGYVLSVQAHCSVLRLRVRRYMRLRLDLQSVRVQLGPSSHATGACVPGPCLSSCRCPL